MAPISDFVEGVLDLFVAAVPLAVLVSVAGVGIWGGRYVDRHPGEKPPVRTAVSLALLLAYLAGLFSITTMGRLTWRTELQLHLFHAFWEGWNYFNIHLWTLFFGNIAMFMPLGILLPLVARPFRRWYVTIPTGFGISLVIEASQYLLKRGIADVDDMFCNTLGNALGYCLCMVALSLAEKKPLRGAAYGALPLLSAAAVIGIFATYYTRPYGNLMDGPTFVTDVSDVEWTLDCELSDEPREVGIGYCQPFTHEECLAFATRLIEERGYIVGRVENYDEWMHFEGCKELPEWETLGTMMPTELIINAYLADRSFNYWSPAGLEDIYGENYADYKYLDDGSMEEDYLREALLEYHVYVPQEAVMTFKGENDRHLWEDQQGWKGWYTFSADQLREGDKLYDGTIEVCVMKGGEITHIEYDMTELTWVADEPILSEAEAYEKLKEGRVAYGQYIEYEDPSQIYVTSCTLDYITDTKGFRQPVYYFELSGTDVYLGSYFVPALRDYIGP